MPSWSSPGSYSYSVPSDVDRLDVFMRGGQGGDGDVTEGDAIGGRPAEVTASFSPNDLPSTLEVRVGGDGEDGTRGDGGGAGGYNGGGSSRPNDVNDGGGGGGGGSDIRDDGGGLSTRYLVAGGGGGAGGGDWAGGDGGYSGGSSGQSGDSIVDAGGGGGGTQTSGGSAGSGDGFPSATSGSLGSGGNGGRGSGNGYTCTGGGGGGGYYGGGGGGVDEGHSTPDAAGAGGASSYAAPAAFDVSMSADEFGNGYVSITEVSFSASNLSFPYVGPSEIDLDWDATGTNDFEIERNGTTIATITGTTYTDTNMSENVSYDYQVFALSGGSRSGSTNVQTVASGGPPTPNSLTEVSRSVDVTVGGLNGDFTETRVHRDGGGETGVLVYSGAPDTTITDSGLLDGEQYTYRFSGVYPRSTSSEESESILLALPAPTDLTVVNAGASTVDIEFTDNANNRESYAVDVAVDDNGNWVRAGSTTATVSEGQTGSVTGSGLLNGQFYGVRAAITTSDTEEYDI